MGAFLFFGAFERGRNTNRTLLFFSPSSLAISAPPQEVEGVSWGKGVAAVPMTTSVLLSIINPRRSSLASDGCDDGKAPSLCVRKKRLRLVRTDENMSVNKRSNFQAVVGRWPAPPLRRCTCVYGG